MFEYLLFIYIPIHSVHIIFRDCFTQIQPELRGPYSYRVCKGRGWRRDSYEDDVTDAYYEVDDYSSRSEESYREYQSVKET